MDNVLTLARLQFASTTIYHFLFVPLTLGLSVLVAWLQTMYYKTNSEDYKKLSKYFGSLFLINFSVGVATGIVQEFQFGMNWAGYSRFVGDIFGAPLAIEALAAFFLESTFLGLWIFGWDKLPKKLHLLTIWLVAFASNLSALWIIIANSFMQEPVGYTLRNGRAEMTDFFAIIKNPHVWLQFPHTVLSGFATAAVFMIAISAYNIMKKKNADMFQKSLKIGVVFGFVSLLLTIGVGDAQGKYLVVHQPMKMAAAEALWESKDSAPLSMFAIIDEENKTNTVDLGIPNMLSFLSYGNFTQRVEGINELQDQFEKEFGPGDYTPPVAVSYISFRAMVFAGGIMLVVIGFAGFIIFRKKKVEQTWLLKVLFLMLPLPYIANSTGWMLTEIGRQPWIVYKVLHVKDAVSKAVSSTSLTISLLGFVLVYGFLAVIDVYLIVKHIKEGGAHEPLTTQKKGAKKAWN